MRTPIYTGILQSDLDFAGFDALNMGNMPAGGGGGGGGIPVFNVQDAPYNAAGDGVTDDTVAIQAALNAAWTAGGGTVYVPAGRYLCNGATDATTKSILKIPFVNYGSTGHGPSVVLQGAFPSPWSFLTDALYPQSEIFTTRTDGVGANGDALFACGPYISGSFPPDYFTGYMNWSKVTIRNIRFILPANPTFYGLRLDSLSKAHVTDCTIGTTNVETEPTHSTVGLRMPASWNYGTNWLYRTFVFGYGTGVKTGEHFRSNACYLSRNKTGLDFTGAAHMSVVDGIIIDGSQAMIRFSSDNHQVFIKMSGEMIAPADAHGWMNTPTGGHIVDPGYVGTGMVYYEIFDDDTGRYVDDISITGAGYLNCVDLVKPSIRNVAGRYLVTGPLAGSVGVASTAFTVSLPVSTVAGGGGVTISLSDGGAGGTFTPSVVMLVGATPATFTYTGASPGVKNLAFVNNGGLINPGSWGITIS